MNSTIVVHSLLVNKTLPPVNTTQVCIFAEYDKITHQRIVKFRSCTYTVIPSVDGSELVPRWVLHNVAGNPVCNPIGWVDFSSVSDIANSSELLNQLQRWGKVNFILTAGN